MTGFAMAALKRTLLAVASVLVAAVGPSSGAAVAQSSLGLALPTFDPEKLEIIPTPYLWLPWTSVDANGTKRGLLSASKTIDPGTLVDHLTWVPFMGQFEFRDGGQFGLLTDYIHAPLKSGISRSRDALVIGGGAGLNLDTGSALLLYRAIHQPEQYLDLGAGVRVWGIDGDISLNRRVLRSVSLTKGGSWVDPMLAIRYHRDLGSGFGATAYGDVGGFGAGANVDWQIIATVDYALRPGIELHAGFRTLNFDISAPRADFTTHLYGPLISATIQLN